MAMKRNKMAENIFTVVIIVGLIFFGMQHRKERHTYSEKLIKDSSYSIGEVTSYSSRRGSIVVPKFISSTGKSAEVKYCFSIEGRLITNSYDSFDAVVPDDGVQEGEKFLVLYQKDNPEESRMFFEYPVKDSTDFKRYVREFEEMKNKKK